MIKVGYLVLTVESHKPVILSNAKNLLFAFAIYFYKKRGRGYFMIPFMITKSLPMGGFLLYGFDYLSNFNYLSNGLAFQMLVA